PRGARAARRTVCSPRARRRGRTGSRWRKGPARRRAKSWLHPVEERVLLGLVLLGGDVALVAQRGELLDLQGDARPTARLRLRARPARRLACVPLHLPVDLLLHPVGMANVLEV